MAQLFFNNCYATLDQPITSGSTSLVVSDKHGFPLSLPSGDYFLVTLLTPGGRYGTNYEVVRVTAISGNTLTVTRGEEYSPKSHAKGALVECRFTAGTVGRFATKDDIGDIGIVLDDIIGAP